MIRSRFGSLEVIVRSPEQESRPTPLLFVHGAYTGAWCWDEHFLPFFAAAGFSCYAISLTGHGRSPGREYLDSLGIGHYVKDIAEVIAALPVPPVVIGHSMGGMVAQKYLERAELPGMVLLSSVPPQGLWASAIGLAFKRPGLMRDINSLLTGGRVGPDTLNETMFAEPLPDDKLREYARLMQPESHRAIWDMTLFDLPQIGRMSLPPMLVLGTEHDHLVPSTLVELTGRSYGVEAEILPGLGHGAMLEKGWQPVAQRILDWLLEQGF